MIRWTGALLLVVLLWCGTAGAGTPEYFLDAAGGRVMGEKLILPDGEWRLRLTPEQYHILREKGTERAHSSPLNRNHETGVYRCAGCGLDLFRSSEKYDSGTGWPSFFAPLARENVRLVDDNSWLMRRTEVLCARCGGHLGHVFNDGPRPTGERYCMNGAALVFVPRK